MAWLCNVHCGNLRENSSGMIKITTEGAAKVRQNESVVGFGILGV